MRIAFARAKKKLGGNAENPNILYKLYDMAAEWWHTPYVRDLLLGRPESEWKFDRRQVLDWLAYYQLRAEIEEKRANKRGQE